MAFRFLILSLAVYATLFSSPASGQIPAPPCTQAMITTFTPCVNFISNSNNNGTTPTAACCNSLSTLMSSGKDCFCQITTGGTVPFQIPINRTSAISLPRACNMPNVPLQCKAAGAPAPAPGLVGNAPTISPNAALSPSVQGLAPTEPLSPRSAPAADATPSAPAADATPSATTNAGGATTSNTGSRTGVSTSSAHVSYSISPFLVVAILAASALKYC